MNNFNIFGAFILSIAGVLSVSSAVAAAGNPLTAASNLLAGTITAPANAVGMYAYSIANLGTAAASVGAQVRAFMSQQSGFTRYPMGKADGSDYQLMLTDSENARVVAMSALYQNRAPALVREGDIVHGQVPMQHSDGEPTPSLENYTAIPYFYNGPLADGGYCYYRPYNSKSMEFRCLQEEVAVFDPNSTERFAFFMSVSAANAASQNMIVITCGIVEAETDSRVLGSSPSLVNPLWIWEANANLAYIPQAMANDQHWDFLKKMLGGVVGHAMTASGGWILNTGLPMLASGFSELGSNVGASMLAGLVAL